MPRRRLAFLLVAAAVFLAGPGAAEAQGPPRAKAPAVLVAEGGTGEVLHGKNADRPLPFASITKLMTALVAVERASPGETVTVAPVVATVGESTVQLRPGERLSVRDLLAAALVPSANDAAYALAAHVGHGDVRAFVRLMNAKARELGLDQTHFVRPDGLDVPGHYSSPRDILTLARAAMRHPLIRKLVRLRTARIAGGRTLVARNDLLGSFPGTIGVKTGQTSKAGWCQVAAARRGGVTIYAIVLGSPSRSRRNSDLGKLLEWGLAQYARVVVVESGRAYATAAVPFSEDPLSLVAREEAHAVVRLGRSLVERATARAVVDPPVERGERLGELRVLDGKRVVARRPLVAAEAVSEPSFAERATWYAGRTLEEAGGMLGGVFGASL